MLQRFFAQLDSFVPTSLPDPFIGMLVLDVRAELGDLGQLDSPPNL